MYYGFGWRETFFICPFKIGLLDIVTNLKEDQVDDIIEEICRKRGLQVIDWFKAGNICDAVCKVQDENSNIFVLKAGSEPRSIAEIRRNYYGYTNIAAAGLSWFVPEIEAASINPESAYILMEYCGDNLVEQSRSEDDPEGLYLQLMGGLLEVYKASLKKGPEGKIAVSTIVDKVIEQYEMHIYMRLDRERTIDKDLMQIRESLEDIDLSSCCFSNWDFTPEDVYLTPSGLKYSDPHEDVFGIPIIDLACFAGVARDAYHLPGSEEGYQLLKDFALLTVSRILSIDSHTAQRLFSLGRFLQCLLSVRFRIETEPEKAKVLFDKSRRYLGGLLL